MDASTRSTHRELWNKGKLVGQKAPLRLKDIWAIHVRLQPQHRLRDLALLTSASTASCAGVLEPDADIAAHHRAGLPPGAFNLVMGRGSVIGEAMVQNRGIAAISFTGPVRVGSRIAQSAVKSFKKVQLEMGGKNPQVVLDDADSAQAVELSVQSAFYSTGQRCTASSRLIVTEGIYPRFVQAMTERMARIKVGDALAAGTDIGPVSSQAQLEQDLDYVAIAKAEGAVLAAGGERLRADTQRYFMSPALFSESTPDMRISREEVFGPVANILRAKNYEEALALANDTEFGLSAGIATTSLKLATHFKRHAQAGMVMVNLPSTTTCPSAAERDRATARESRGRYAAEFYTTVKTAYTLA